MLPAIFHIHRSVFWVTGEDPELRRGQVHPHYDLDHIRGSYLIYGGTVSEFQSRGTKSLRILVYASGVMLTFELQIDTEKEIPGAGNIH